MYNLTQFVVSTPTYNTTALNLANLFMEEVFWGFGMSAIIVIDNGCTFKGTFQTMYKSLKITYWFISRGNHKGNSVETFHLFLNKTQTITGGDPGTQNLPSMHGILCQLMIQTSVKVSHQLEENSAFSLMLVYVLYHL